MDLLKIDHVGIRVMNFERSVEFYKIFGFSVIREDYKERVLVLKHPSGIELNLLDSGNNTNNDKNILMDVEEKYPGYTHLAIRVSSMDAVLSFCDSVDIEITEGPVIFGDGKKSIFIRDPDRNVIEFTQVIPTI